SHADRRAVPAGPDGQVLDIRHGPDVAASPYDVFLAGHLKASGAHFVIAVADGVGDLRQWNLVGQQAVRIDVDLILLHETADRGNFRHALNARKPIAQIPVVERPQLLKTVLPGLVDKRVLKGPADAGRIGAELGRDALRKLAGELAHIFEHPRATPINVRSF